MVKTYSSMVSLGTQAPDFSLIDPLTQKTIHLERCHGSKATVIMFICNHCPYVKHIASELPALARDYVVQGVQFIAINSNDQDTYPDDSPEHMKTIAKQWGIPFPYLFDPTQDVARAYHATCTPDFFIFDSSLRLVYRGQLDDSRPGNAIPVTGASVRQALDQLLHNQPITTEQKPSMGCNIKWRVASQ